MPTYIDRRISALYRMQIKFLIATERTEWLRQKIEAETARLKRRVWEVEVELAEMERRRKVFAIDPPERSCFEENITQSSTQTAPRSQTETLSHSEMRAVSPLLPTKMP